MSELLNKAKACVGYLRLALPETGQHPGHTKDDRFRDWQKAAYDDPDFAYDGDYFAVYEECRDKDTNSLNNEQVRGCITFLLRQMRNQYAPYPCLTSGELLELLERWIELNDKEDAE